MDQTEIPVLTKKVQSSSATPVAEDGITLTPSELASLTASIKQSILEELTLQWTEQLSQQVNQALTEHAERERQTMSEFAQLIQQSIETEARAHIQLELPTIEETLKSSLQAVSQQQVTATEEALAALMELQQAQLAIKAETLREEIQQSLTAHIQTLETQHQDSLSTAHAAATAAMSEHHAQSLQASFAEQVESQMATFREKIHAEMPALEGIMQDKVQSCVQEQMTEIERQLNTQLKTRIIEVLQGIRFVMPGIKDETKA